ncbi:MAG: transglycosylase domain-containing protein [Clostridia bacterium]|nr:transglycosylase domain-containing protein [Clostridia bacterium]
MADKKKRTNKITNKNSKTKARKHGKKVENSSQNSLIRKKDVKMKFKYKHPKLALALKIFLIIFIILFVIGAGIVIGLFSGLLGEDFSIDITELVLDENSVIIDSEGNILAELSGNENRKIITLEDMSPYLPKAYIAIEDERYETHHGVDLKGTGRAILSFVTNGGKSTAGGGSTITQQLVKNVTQDKASKGIEGVIRKLKEWVKAYQVEEVMSKDQILELYLNLIFIGGKENRGVEIGSEYYFNKSAKDLSIAECAFLAGINHSPNAYSPYSGKDVTEKTAKRTKTVLGKMKELKYINQEEYDAAVAEVEAGFKFENGAKGNVYSSHTDALISQLIEQIMEEKQISKNAAETYLYSSGLVIYSTEVNSIQTAMEEEVQKKKYLVESDETRGKKNVERIYAEAAMVVIDPKTGYVVGCVGQLGEKTTSRGQNRATQSTRSTGSSFKPLANLVPGIEEGTITAATIYDNKNTIFNQGKPNQYKPKNYNDSHLGFRNVRYSTLTSQNIPFVKIMAELGNEKCMEYLKKMGISTLDDKKDAGLSTAIGGLTYGVSPLEMAAAYASIANDGTYIEPTFYSKVEDSDGKVVLEPNQKTERVCSEDTAYIVKDLLTSVVEHPKGTATYCKISGIDVAAKTGTTNDDFDRWLCGFTNYYAGAAWFGFDDPEDVDFSGNPAGQIFAGVMKAIHKGLPGSTFERTANIVTAKVCAESGRLATDKCTNTYSEVFIKGKLPKTCDAHDEQYTVCSVSGLLPNEFCPSENLETRQAKYIIEKERLGLWNTTEPSTLGSDAPTGYCTVHKKVEVVIPVEPEIPDEPTEEPEEPENPPVQNPEEDPWQDTEGDTEGQEPTQPSTPSGDNTGDTTGSGDNQTTNPQT